MKLKAFNFVQLQETGETMNIPLETNPALTIEENAWNIIKHYNSGEEGDVHTPFRIEIASATRVIITGTTLAEGYEERSIISLRVA